ncbi:hypothetical protein [Bradyrhizobium sp. CCBAU 51765]|uniref:hypothetical protein n=1 Tax=Bradyrhizobium sp. CCBAU 51765 TaxID=1325102 RepID=UPI001887527F|nr:hypothetical protein [Bradyrhizobium sp. CCBAU 51765]QOZ09564.1 hypothetical protein XH96_20010 [Bradyrhizobium sp. CCBAU 51765]
MSHQHQQHLEEIDRSLADIQVMGQVAMRSAQNLQQDGSGGYRLPEQETSTLLFSVHDILDRIGKLRANLVPENEVGPDAGTVDEADIPEGGMNTHPTPKDDVLDGIWCLERMTLVGIRLLDGASVFKDAEGFDALSFCLHDLLERIQKMDRTARQIQMPAS